jgi:hypothetical protein
MQRFGRMMSAIPPLEMVPSENCFMIITTNSGRSFDTDHDLTAPERHILQKLFIWVSFASSTDEFNQKKEEALLKGWNNSGPIPESEALRMIIADLEEKVSLRLNQPPKSS